MPLLTAGRDAGDDALAGAVRHTERGDRLGRVGEGETAVGVAREGAEHARRCGCVLGRIDRLVGAVAAGCVADPGVVLGVDAHHGAGAEAQLIPAGGARNHDPPARGDAGRSDVCRRVVEAEGIRPRRGFHRVRLPGVWGESGGQGNAHRTGRVAVLVVGGGQVHHEGVGPSVLPSGPVTRHDRRPHRRVWRWRGSAIGGRRCSRSAT